MNLASKDLNLLVCLRALLEEANVTRAGERLAMGQPAMSVALSRLRAHYDDELLVKVGRELELTPMARKLLPQVQATIPLLEQTLGGDDDFDPNSTSRVFSVVCSDFVALELGPLLQRVMVQAPGLSFNLLSPPLEPTDRELTLLSHDFLCTVPGIGFEGKSIELFRDHFVCVVDKDNPELVDGRLSLEGLTRLPQAVAYFGQGHPTPPSRRLRELGLDPRSPIRVEGHLPLISAVAKSDLVAIVPSRFMKAFGGEASVIAVPTPMPFGEIEMIFAMWWHHTKEADSGHRWLREAIAGLIAEGSMAIQPN